MNRPAALLARDARWHVDHVRVLGSRAEIQVLGTKSLVDVGILRLRMVEATIGRLLPMSEINRLHRSAGQWVAVSDDLLHALREAAALYRLTDGLCDPTVAPTALDLEEPLGLAFDQDHRVRFAGESHLDLSVIASGLAADAVVESLLAAGAEAVQVTVGRTTRVGGTHPEGRWMLRQAHPTTGRPFLQIPLTHGALSNVLGPGGGRWHPSRGTQLMIDPRTGGTLTTDVLGVVVLADRAALADALARATVVAGAAAAPHVLRHAREAFVVTEHGVVHL